MTDIGKGDRVECIDARPHQLLGHVGLVAGNIYTVGDVHPKMASVFLQEPTHPIKDTSEVFWALGRFKPYRPGDTAAKLFGQHLDVKAPSKPKIPEPA